jgi:integrase
MPKLTKRLIDSTKPGEKDIVCWDGELKGFGVRIMPSGVKSFVIQYRAHGRSRRLTIGRYGRMTLDQARKAAREKLTTVDQGGDPAEEKKRGRQAITVKELAQRYLEEHARSKKKPSSAFRDERLLERFILPALGGRKIKTITRTDVAQLHHKIGQATPIQANRTLAVMSKMMTLAIRWGLYQAENPCRHVERFKERKRERYLTQKELARLGQVLTEAEASNQISPAAAAALRLLALTGMRVGEVLSLQWGWIDFQRGVIFFPDSKTGQKVLALGEPAQVLLGNISKTAGNPHVFAGKKFGRHLVDINSPWRFVREGAGLKGVRLHDLRHTHASVGAAAGLSLPTIGALLGHSEPATTARYAHLAQDPVKRAADRVSGLIDRAMNTPAKKKVISINANRK